MDLPEAPPLCAAPHSTERDTSVKCSLFTGSFIPLPLHDPTPPPPSSLLFFSYNINYNGWGGEGSSSQSGLPPILNLLQTLNPDVILLSEVAYGCYGPGVEALAEALGFAFAYSTAFVSTSSECTTGNAVISRYPISTSEGLRFDGQCCWFDGRAGGRGAVLASIDVGLDISLAVASTHLESGNADEFLPAVTLRASQARQIASELSSFCPSCQTRVIAGDLNAPFRAIDPVGITLRYSGFRDTHSSLSHSHRRTYEGAGHEGDFRERFGMQTLDYIYMSSDNEAKHPGACHDPDLCHGWSDHIGIWSVIPTGGSGAVNYDASLLSSLSQPTGEPYKTDWLWLNFAAVSLFLLLHGSFLYWRLRHPKRKATPPTPYVPAKKSTKVLAFVIAISAIIGALMLSWHRDVSFMTALFIGIYTTISPHLGSSRLFILHVIVRLVSMSLILSLVFNIPGGRPDLAVPAFLQALWLYREIRGGSVDGERVGDSLASTVLLLLFVTFDFLASGGGDGAANPFMAGDLVSPAIVVSCGTWVVLVLVNGLVGSFVMLLGSKFAKERVHSATAVQLELSHVNLTV